jgi:hypothetical protein
MVPIDAAGVVQELLDLFFRESQLNVYAGNRVVRPPYAPTIGVIGAQNVRRLVDEL